MLVAALLAALLQDKAPEETHTAKKGALTPVFELDAAFEAKEVFELRLRFESGMPDAPLKSVAGNGAEVKKGEVLLALDGSALKKQIAAAELDLRSAQSTLAKEQADHALEAKADAFALEQARNALKDAETALKQFEEVEGPHLLLNAQLNVKSMEDMVADQVEELEQLEKMYKSEELTNATAEIVVRRARRSLERVKTYAKMSRENQDTVVKIRHPQARRRYQEAVESARTSLARLQTAQTFAAVQRDVQLGRAKAALERQEEQLAKLRRDLEATTVQAPFDGRVFWGQFQNGQWPPAEQVRQTLQVGEKPHPGPVLLTLCGTALRVRAELPEKHYFALEPGAPAKVVPLALPGQAVTGALAAKAVAALPRASGPAFDARIDVDVPPAGLLHGMKAKATLSGRALKDVLLLPLAAVKRDGDKGTVKVVKDGKSAEREVKLGPSDGTLIQVREGLSEGETVAVPKG